MRKPITMLILALVVPAVTGAMQEKSRKPDLSVPLAFLPQGTSGLEAIALPGTMIDKPVEIRVEDARNQPDPLILGAGTDSDDRVFPIRATADVVPFVGDVVARLAEEKALKKSPTPERQLELRLTRFAVNEVNKAVGSSYAAEVGFAYTLKDAAGTTLAEGSASGVATRYGKARSSENCSEVLSDALKEAFAATLGGSNLQTAWASGLPSSGTGGAPAGKGQASATTGTVEERLEKLDDLRAKGLISEEEYKSARAEILKSL